MNRKMVARALLRVAKSLVAGEIPDLRGMSYDERKNLAETTEDPDILRELAKWKDRRIQSLILRNPNITSDVISELLNNAEDHTVVLGIARNPKTPETILRKLANDWFGYREEVAENPSTPEDVLRELASQFAFTYDLKYNVARNPNAPADLVNYLKNKINADKITDENLLREFAKDENPDVRIKVLKNPNTPADVLMELAKDEDEYVRKAVTNNPNTPVDILRELAKDENRVVREAVAENPKTPVDILRELAKDEDKWVRAAVTENPNTPVDVLMELAKDEDEYVRKAVTNNPNTPKDVLRELKKNMKQGKVSIFEQSWPLYSRTTGEYTRDYTCAGIYYGLTDSRKAENIMRKNIRCEDFEGECAYGVESINYDKIEKELAKLRIELEITEPTPDMHFDPAEFDFDDETWDEDEWQENQEEDE